MPSLGGLTGGVTTSAAARGGGLAVFDDPCAAISEAKEFTAGCSTDLSLSNVSGADVPPQLLVLAEFLREPWTPCNMLEVYSRPPPPKKVQFDAQ